MVFTTTVKQRDSLATFTCSGCADTSQLLRLIDLIAAVCHGQDSPRVLADLAGAAVIDTVGHVSLGTYAALKLKKIGCLAVVVGTMARPGISERIVRRQGILSRAFTSRHEALDWLHLHELVGRELGKLSAPPEHAAALTF